MKRMIGSDVRDVRLKLILPVQLKLKQIFINKVTMLSKVMWES